MNSLSNDFINILNDQYEKLSRLSEAESGQAPAPGKWSPKEIIGHLIDSAANNHQRFVRVQIDDGISTPGYAQEDWVQLQYYREESWENLLTLWRSYNLHLVHVVGNMSSEMLNRKITKYESAEISWIAVPEDNFTIEYLITDYLGHLRHHLAQILIIN